MTALLFALFACGSGEPDDTSAAADDTSVAADDTSVAADDTSASDDTSAGDDDSAAGDDDSVAGDDDSTPVNLNGDQPDSPVPAPEFTALNQRGETVGRDQLLWHPTVLWFFPAAGTPG